MNYRLLLAVFMLLFGAPAKAQYSFLIHKTYAQQYIAIDTLFYFNYPLRQDSAAFFRETNKLGALGRQANDRELVLEAKLLQTDYCLMAGKPYSHLYEPEMLNLIAVADKEKILQLQIRVRQILGHYYLRAALKPGKALDLFLQSYRLLDKVPAHTFPNKQELIGNVGSAYFYLNDLPNARRYISESLKLPPSYKKRYNISLHNTQGLIFRGEGKYDSAEYYFKKTIRVALSKNDTTWAGIASGNLGISYFLRKRYREALPLLLLDVRESFKAGEIDNGLGSLLKAAEINLLQGNNAEAASQLTLARAKVSQAKDPYKFLKPIYQLKARLVEKSGNTSLAFRYADSALTVQDTLTKRLAAFARNKAEQKFLQETYRAETMEQEMQQQKKLLVRNGMIAGILMFGLLLAGILNYKRKSLKRRKSELEATLAIAQKQLRDYTGHLHEKNARLEHFTTEYHKLLQHNQPSVLIEEPQRMLELRKASILTEDQWVAFQEMFEQAYPGYLQRLKAKLPDLSPAEIRFMLLNKLKFTGKEIQSILGVGASSVRTMRHRLRKKLDLPEEVDLEDFAGTI